MQGAEGDRGLGAEGICPAGFSSPEIFPPLPNFSPVSRSGCMGERPGMGMMVEMHHYVKIRQGNMHGMDGGADMGAEPAGKQEMLERHPVAMMSEKNLARTVKNCDCAHGVEMPWGYIVRSGGRPSPAARASQWLSGLIGFSLILAASSLWIMPGSSFGEDIVVLKYGLSIVLAAVGILFLWFGNQGACYELQVDISRGELREAVRNRKGQARILQRVPFERIGSVFIDRSSPTPGNHLTLLLRYRDTAEVIEVARAEEEALTMMRDRLARDILGLSLLRKRHQEAMKRQAQPWLRKAPGRMETAG